MKDKNKIIKEEKSNDPFSNLNPISQGRLKRGAGSPGPAVPERERKKYKIDYSKLFKQKPEDSTPTGDDGSATDPKKPPSSSGSSTFIGKKPDPNLPAVVTTTVGDYLNFAIPPSQGGWKETETNCDEDLLNNLGFYSGTGLAFTVLLWPLLKPVGIVGAQVARSILNPATLPKDFKAAQSRYKTWAKNVKGGYGAQAAGLAKAAAARSLMWVYGLTGLRNLGQAASLVRGGAGQKFRGLKTTGNVAMGIKTSASFFALIAIGWEVYQSYSDDREVDPNSMFDYYVNAFQEMLKFLCITELSLEQMIVSLNPETSPDCRMRNTIVMAVGGAALARALGVGVKNPAGIKQGDDLAAMIRAEQTSQANKLGSEMKEVIKYKLIDGTGKGALGKRFDINIPPQQVDEYIDILFSGGRKAQDKALKYANKQGWGSNIKDVDPTIIHNDIMQAINKVGYDFVGAYASQYTALNQRILGKLTQSQQNLKYIKGQIGARMKSVIKAMQSRNLKATGTPAADATEMLAGINAGSKLSARVVKNLDEIADMTQLLDDALLTGRITPVEAVGIFSKSIKPAIAQSRTRIKLHANSVAGVVGYRPGTGSIVDNYLNNLKALNQSPQFFDEIVKELGMKQIFTQAGRASRSAGKAKINSQEIKQLFFNRLLQGSNRLDPGDLEKLSKELVRFEKNFANAATGYGTRFSDNVSLVGGVVVYAVLDQILGAIFVEPDDISDINTWLSCEIANSLVWEDVPDSWYLKLLYPAMRNSLAANLTIRKSFEETNVDAFIEIMRQLKSQPGIMLMMYDEYIFKYVDDAPGGFLDLASEMRASEIDSAYMDNLVMGLAEKLSDMKKVNALVENKWNSVVKEKVPDSPGTMKYRNKWVPILIKLLVINSGLNEKLKALKSDVAYRRLYTKEKRVRYIKNNLLKYDDDAAIEKWKYFINCFEKESERKKESVKMSSPPDKKNESINNDFLRRLVSEQMNENYGKGYTPYPYHSQIGEENEPAEDYIQDWKDFELALVRDESKEMAITVAKIFIEDLELFNDVLDMIGSNQSLGTEILKKFREKEQNNVS